MKSIEIGRNGIVDMVTSDRQMAELGIFVHGLLAGLHILGMAYNIRKHNWGNVLMHGAATVFDVHSAHQHMKDLG